MKANNINPKHVKVLKKFHCFNEFLLELKDKATYNRCVASASLDYVSTANLILLYTNFYENDEYWRKKYLAIRDYERNKEADKANLYAILFVVFTWLVASLFAFGLFMLK